MAQAAGGKFRGKLEDAVFDESINFFRAWRQKQKNGILPIGIAEVGKTTLLAKFDSEAPNVFLEFNRTVEATAKNGRLRQDFIAECKGLEFAKQIDVPGELPSEWARAYFDYTPRVLIVMVDNRDSAYHVEQIRKFMALLREGPSAWQRTKSIVGYSGPS